MSEWAGWFSSIRSTGSWLLVASALVGCPAVSRSAEALEDAGEPAGSWDAHLGPDDAAPRDAQVRNDRSAEDAKLDGAGKPSSADASDGGESERERPRFDAALDATPDGASANDFDGSSRDATMGGEADAETVELGARIVAHRYRGSLCPEGSLLAAIADDQHALTATFSEDLSADEDPLSGDCALTLTVEVPSGYAFGSLYVYAQGLADSVEPDRELARLRITSSFGEGAEQEREFELGNGNYLVAPRFDRVWSPTCSGSTRAELTIAIEATASPQSYFGLAALDLTLLQTAGSTWKRCDTGQMVTPRPSVLGEACAGPAEQPCADGLACDRYDGVVPDELLRRGVCIDPSTAPSPAKKGEPCGGLVEIACAAGLTCHYSSEQAAQKRVRGVCGATVAGANERCAGFPALACGEGLFCSANKGDVCKPGDGSLGSGCEAGILDCDDGLVCQAGRCERELAEAGEACGGVEEIRCTLLHVCEPSTSRCVLEPNAGKLGGRCSSSVACESGLTCTSFRCRQ